MINERSWIRRFFEDYFPQGWRFFQLQHQKLIEGFWNKNERQQFWFANGFATLVLLPAAFEWGTILSTQGFWWVIGGAVACHFAYCAIYMAQDTTEGEFWMFIQDVAGRFLWQIPHIALITFVVKWFMTLIF